MNSRRLCSVPLACLLLACGSGNSASQTTDSDGGDSAQPADDASTSDATTGQDATETPDAGADAAPESDGGDAGEPGDAATDAAGDATEETDASGTDGAGTDAAGTDAAGVDASGIDAGVDASGIDAGVDAGPTYAVGGAVTGLAAAESVVLQDNLGDNLTVSSNTTFTFPTQLANGAPYSVTVLTSPTAPVSQTCTVTGGGVGNVVGASVTGVAVNCQTNQFTLGGSVSGIANGETVTLADDAGDQVTVGNGPFSFATAYASGAMYTVTVPAQPTQPILQSCTVGVPTAAVGGANVNLSVTCTTTPFALGGTVSGLGTGKSFVLTEASTGQTLTVSANGAFAFSPGVPNGNAYDVTVSTQPASAATDAAPQVCNVLLGTGTMPQSAVSSVLVDCGTNCAAFLAANPAAPSGSFTIDPDGSGPAAAFQAYCDMTFGSGGWTLIESTNGGACGPGSEASGVVAQGSCAYVPLASAEALANLASTVHVRSASGNATPTQYATSATALAIGNLRIGAMLDANEDPGVAQAQWTTVGVPASALDFNVGCMSGPTAWPNVYWACGNSSGWHLVSPQGQGNYSTWQWATPNVAMEVYVR